MDKKKSNTFLSKLNDWSEVTPSRKHLLGLTFAMLSGFAFTISNFMVQVTIQLNTKELIPTMEVVFCRTFIQLIIVSSVACINRSKLTVSKEDVWALIAMGLAGYFSIVLIFLSLDKIPLSDTLVITFSGPFFCVIFSRLILKETAHWFDICCGLLSFVGIIIVARPEFLFGKTTTKTVLFKSKRMTNSVIENVYFTGVLFAFSGGACLALYFVLTRRFAAKHSQLLMLFYPSLFGTLLSPLSIPLNRIMFVIPQSMFVFLSMCSVGILSFIALQALALSLKFEDATFVSLVRNLDVIYAFVMQYFVFNIHPTKWNVSGGLIIVIATTLMSLRKANVKTVCMPSSKDKEAYTLIKNCSEEENSY